jgi:hypothetical protein
VQRLKGKRIAQARSLLMNDCTTKFLVSAGYTHAELFSAGASPVQLLQCGIGLAELEALGYSLQDLRSAGYSTADLYAAGHSLPELVQAGATASEIKALHVFSLLQMREAGVSAAGLKAAGCTAEELHAAMFSAGELKRAGWAVAELKKAGSSGAALRQAGCSVFELRTVGYSLAEIQSEVPPIAGGTLLLEGPGSVRTTPARGETACQQITDGVPAKLAPDGSAERPAKIRGPPKSPAPIYDQQGNQVNKLRWCNRTMGYIGTDAFAR